jgi:uncharacterized protein (TIGR02246 family)
MTRKSHIRILLLLTITLLISCGPQEATSTQEAVSTREAVEKAVLAMERAALDRWSSGDPLGYAQSFAEDATYFDDIGASTRLDGLEAINAYLESLAGKGPAHSYEIIDPKVQVLNGVAILTLHYQATLEDGQVLPTWKATSVYHLIDGSWQVVHANWSLVKD